jgi:hypothetical protein
MFPDSDVTGLDRSELGIRCATERYTRGNLGFLCSEDLSAYPDHAFDMVTCFEVLEHVEDWRAMTRDIARVTSRFMLLSFPTGRMRQFEQHVGHLRNFRRGQFERFASELGFRSVSIFYAGFPFYSPLFRNCCDFTNSGGAAFTIGKYGWWQRRLSDLIFIFFRYFSFTKHGDQFCGLFERVIKEENSRAVSL